MLRLALASILLISASLAAAQTVAHQDANGASANCPGTVESSDPAEPAPASSGAPARASGTAPASGAALGETARPAASRPAPPRVRWHSFLPGMMK